MTAGAELDVARYLIAGDGERWYVRRIASVSDDLVRGERIYRCDLPIANDLTWEKAVAALRKALEAKP